MKPSLELLAAEDFGMKIFARSVCSIGVVVLMVGCGGPMPPFRFGGSLPQADHPRGDRIRMAGPMYSVLYTFQGGKDGAKPIGLTDLRGLLYGASGEGGGTNCFSNQGCGTVYRISTTGTETVLYSFRGGTDGLSPNGALLQVSDMLYGTTEFGGGAAACYLGCGVVYGIGAT